MADNNNIIKINDNLALQSTITNFTAVDTITSTNLPITIGDYWHDTSTGNTFVTTDSNYVLRYDGCNWNYEQLISDIVDNKLKEKENENKMVNNFGPYSNNNLRLSPYGVAIKNKSGKWVSYNKDTGRLIDVDIFNIEIDPSKVFYRIPKPITDIEIGNLIIHNGELVFIERIENASRLVVINPSAGTEMTVLPTTSPFGYDYVDAIISLTDYFPEADDKNPWGNLLPLMMLGKDNSMMAMMLAMGENIEDIDPMMLFAANGNHPLLMLYLMKQKKSKDKKVRIEKFKKALNKEDIDE